MRGPGTGVVSAGFVLAGALALWGQAPAASVGDKDWVGAPVKELAPAKALSAKQRTAREEEWRREIRHQLYVPEVLPPLEAKTWSAFSPVAGVIAERVTYQTADGMLVPAVVYRPDPKTFSWQGKLPGIVVVNGHGGDKSSWYAFYSGMMFASAGAMVVTYDPIGEGERNVEKKSRAGSHDKIVDAPHWGQRLAGLMQVDAMQAVNYLAARPEVDAGRIAVVGYSMGAFIAGITGAIDPGIHAVILSGGGVYDGPGGYFDSNPLPCQSPPYKALSVLGDRGAVLYSLNAARGPMFVMNGDNDTVMDMVHHGPAWFASVRTRAVALRGTDRDMFTTVLYPGISHRTSWVDRDGVAWLGRQIRFVNWTDKDIATMPVTHVSEWAKANGVDITANYIREDREGGLDALGKGYPGIKREDLMVLPERDWEAMKGRLTYEAWAVKTLAAERAATP
ncbi:alpha/beta hydrolase family protein [Edaphobacter aggregans]|uniref:Alpha/beta hydrolase family protein n=1 Tax=Edaphobacter aggregans TaxID=570835 RepID=A0A428ML94_9BACT|nr:alpha/beta fold hydrolase [Edaphobacter aggregans]RSL17630.1 alpha/beta hydrolase family protein [Edaphobacter aggregans]